MGPAQVRARRPPGPARARDRVPGAHPHLHRHGRDHARAEDIDIDIDPSDIEFSAMRSSGSGGQHVNTTTPRSACSTSPRASRALRPEKSSSERELA
ncbi:peptide chain release factor-like protein [Plesiocystis pacifica]|uniref:peptide chain release factor family protein n=1 Tax=Plesiocystis pacifica TaxID=191768 RepID=UPI0012FC3486